MGLVKDTYHEAICAAANDTEYNHAAEEYYAELKRIERNRQRMEAEKKEALQCHAPEN